MFRRLGSRIAIACGLMVAMIGILAAASPAQASTVGPNQYFVGQLFGVGSSEIGVVCPTPTGTGHPIPGQTIDVALVLPPITPTIGYTGTEAVEIDAALVYSSGPVVVAVPLGTFTQYFDRLSIPTSITVPCSGSGEIRFTPYPLDSGRPSIIPVTFN